MKVELTEKEWAALLQCAGLAPHNQVRPLIDKVLQQIERQKQAEKAAATE